MFPHFEKYFNIENKQNINLTIIKLSVNDCHQLTTIRENEREKVIEMRSWGSVAFFLSLF